MKILECRSPSAGYLLIPVKNIAYISQDQERENPTRIFLKNNAVVDVCESVKELKKEFFYLDCNW